MTNFKSNVLKELDWRGSIFDSNNLEELDSHLSSSNRCFYIGFDPTADSLHVGSMLPLTCIRRMLRAGHKPIFLVGTATGMIGDPSGKSEERNLLSEDIINQNAAAIEAQVRHLFRDEDTSNFRFLKNSDWLKPISYIEILRDVGKHFSVNQMMARDSVRTRLEEREQGISYTEFSYMVLQAYDFLHLYEAEDCTLQIGGSDQWGNIASGLDLIRRKHAQGSAFGLTIPLLVGNNGKKFGKTEEGTVWLDENRTSPYSFYQFWLNVSDEDVIRYSKLFTDFSKEEIQSLENSVSESPEKREAQTALAIAMTDFVHGPNQTARVQKAAEALFSKSEITLNAEDLLMLKNDIPFLETNIDSKQNILDLMCATGAAESKAAARRLVESGCIKTNGISLTDPKEEISNKHFIDDKVMLLKVGKKKHFLVSLK